MKFIFSKQLSIANVAIVSETQCRISVSKKEANHRALISLQFKESPEILSHLTSRTEADMFPFHREEIKQPKILTEPHFREVLV